MRSLFKLLRDERGGIAVTFGLVLPLLLSSVAAAVEIGVLAHRTSKLQNAADAGALAAARQLSVAQSSPDAVLAAAQAMVVASIESDAELSVTTTVRGNSVELNVAQTAASMFGNMMGAASYSLTAKAIARVTSARLCLLALAPDKKGAIDVNQSAVLTAPKCSVVSNSTSKAGIVAAGGSRVDAEAVCSAG
jgi:Flp pilus assembly protein TadG